MSLTELKESVLALPEKERHDLVVWLNRQEANYGDVPGEALDQLAAEIWDQDDRHAPPTHPARGQRSLSQPRAHAAHRYSSHEA